MKKICGPDAMATGWIPYFKDITKVPPNAYTRHRFSFPAFSMLFDSGNTTPPSTLTGYPDWRARVIDPKEFRGGSALMSVELECGEQGPTRVSRKPIRFVGYTPANVQVNWSLMGDPKFTTFYMGGTGAYGQKVGWEADCAVITHWVRFKLGKIGNLGNWLFTGQWAPYAWMMMRYKICCDGSVEVKFGGSRIPSQWYYVGWAQVGSYDMLSASTAQINGFLGAGDCLDAPGSWHYTWTGTGRRC